jgi:hypothetical protein
MHTVRIDSECAGFDRVWGCQHLSDKSWILRGHQYKPLRLICPLLPSGNHSLANMRKAPAICSRSHFLSASLLEGLGIWCSLFTSPFALVAVLRADVLDPGSTAVTTEDIICTVTLKVRSQEWLTRREITEAVYINPANSSEVIRTMEASHGPTSRKKPRCIYDCVVIFWYNDFRTRWREMSYQNH